MGITRVVSKKWLDSGYILKAFHIKFAGRLIVRCDMNGGINCDCKLLG
jgi:hypothetical protein